MRFVKPKVYKVDSRTHDDKPNLDVELEYIPVEFEQKEFTLPANRYTRGMALAKMLRKAYG